MMRKFRITIGVLIAVIVLVYFTNVRVDKKTANSDSTDSTIWDHERGDKKPNIVFILADDLGWSDIGYNNPYVITPTLDNLAREGIILNQFYAISTCSPTRASLMSGYYAYRVGFQNCGLSSTVPKGLSLNFTLLPERLRQLGYSTYMVGKWHLGFCKYEYTPNGRGFDHFYGFYGAAQDHYTHRSGTYLDLREDLTPDWNQNGTYSTNLFGGKAAKYIAEHDINKPLFLYLAFSNVHSPLQVPKKYSDIYPPMDNGRRIKLGMVSALDDAVHTVVSALKDRGLWENTLLIFMSDNGAPVNDKSFGNNWPYRGAKASMWEGGTRVVAFAHGRMLKKHSYIYNGLMHVVDWYPTLVSVAGGDTDSDIDGLDMWASISQGSDSTRKEFIYHIEEVFNPVAAIRIEDYKLIVGKASTQARSKWVPPPEANGKLGELECDSPLRSDGLYLFNLTNDPLECHNLADKEPQRVEDMKRRLEQFKHIMIPPFGHSSPADKSFSPTNFGGDTKMDNV
ncbi:arylsulfatase B-like [Glandiceps talaboti]